MSFADNRESYGWVSIILHWISAGAVLFLWFVGQSAALAETPEARAPLQNQHVSVALFVAVLLVSRVLWRLYSGHPRVVHNRGEWIVSMFAHYLMLIALVTMVATGLTMFLLAESCENVCDWAASVHAFSARSLIVVIVLHFTAGMYHLMFCDDDVLLRMFVPKGKSE